MECHYLFPPTLTATIVIVSLPKMSTTLTASLRRPGGHSRKTLVRSNLRSFLVRKDREPDWPVGERQGKDRAGSHDSLDPHDHLDKD